eukprot:TRINITY_DN2905_c0_g1_i11.p1 TRINITY_DN2905_c0_g1~~TRINITY_DN2905_c0_g1_i11.p1  ORF type:complete len:253 (-),score=78.29 TRINITY_DN2905_c0_g1_i11:391-1149(-)
MFKRKLAALNYPSAENFDAQNQTEFRGLVLWLEDQKIRHLKIDDRAGLRQVNTPDWDKQFQSYLNSLECPKLTRREETIDWLLGLAVRLEYGDNKETYSKHNTQNVDMNGGGGDKPKLIHSNPLDNLDFTSPEFVAGVDKLADFLNIPKHPDHLITLQAVASFISTRLHPAAIQDPTSVIPEGQPFDLKANGSSNGGQQNGDIGMMEAAQILRLLHINDLRLLQTRINESIVSVQTVTANPKTDTRLGKVGR